MAGGDRAGFYSCKLFAPVSVPSRRLLVVFAGLKLFVQVADKLAKDERINVLPQLVEEEPVPYPALLADGLNLERQSIKCYIGGARRCMCVQCAHRCRTQFATNTSSPFSIHLIHWGQPRPGSEEELPHPGNKDDAEPVHHLEAGQ